MTQTKWVCLWLQSCRKKTWVTEGTDILKRPGKICHQKMKWGYLTIHSFDKFLPSTYYVLRIRLTITHTHTHTHTHTLVPPLCSLESSENRKQKYKQIYLITDHNKSCKKKHTQTQWMLIESFRKDCLQSGKVKRVSLTNDIEAKIGKIKRRPAWKKTGDEHSRQRKWQVLGKTLAWSKQRKGSVVTA